MADTRKRIIYCLCIVLFFLIFCCCAQDPDNQVIYETKGTADMRDRYMVDDDCIAGTNVAVSIGKAVVAGWQQEGMYSDYVLKECIYYSDDLCWILTFYPEEPLPGATLCVKISQSNGEIEMWVNE